MRDHYKVLEVQPSASFEVIEKAYKALSLKYHPDRRDPDEQQEATRKMQQLNASYAVLSDPARRRDYDAKYFARIRATEEETQMLRVFLDHGLIGLFKGWIKEGME